VFGLGDEAADGEHMSPRHRRTPTPRGVEDLGAAQTPIPAPTPAPGGAREGIYHATVSILALPDRAGSWGLISRGH
jgi:hypothetical protein